jgi:hypothetical protein
MSSPENDQNAREPDSMKETRKERQMAFKTHAGTCPECNRDVNTLCSVGYRLLVEALN